VSPRGRPLPEAVAAHYDSLDRFYRAIWGEHVHHGYWCTGRESREAAVRALVDRVAEAGALRGRRVVDVGCGYGATAQILAADYDAHVTGITISRRQWEHARAVASGLAPALRPRFVLGDWLANAFPDASFERVLAIECLAHMADRAAFFREARRVLEPSGRLVVCAWLSADEPTPRQRRHLLEPICREGRLVGLASRADCLRWIDEADLVLERFEDWTAHVQRTWPICMRRALAHLARHPSELLFLADPRQSERVFARSLVRLWLAYRSGAMRYGSFIAARRRPTRPSGGPRSRACAS
jgi:tocopherol O-methyltransferase